MGDYDYDALDLRPPSAPSITIRREGGIPPWIGSLSANGMDLPTVFAWTERSAERKSRRRMARYLKRTEGAAATTRTLDVRHG